MTTRMTRDLAAGALLLAAAARLRSTFDAAPSRR